MFSLKYWPLLALALFFFSCTSDPLKVDASGVELNVKAVRADSLIWYSTKDQTLTFHRRFLSNDKEVYQYLLGQCIQIKSPKDCVVVNALEDFRSDKYMIGLQKDLDGAFKNVLDDHRAIIQAFKRIKYHLDSAAMPVDIWYANTIFNASAFSTEESVMIGLERYLGPENENIKKLPSSVFFEWIKQDMERTFLSRDAVASWCMTNLVTDSRESLAEAMVFWGKVLYLTEAGFFDRPDHWILRYNEEEMAWALENELSIWNYLVEDELLFKKDERLITNLLMPGPFTIGLPEKGPDRLGQFIGWRMIHAYVNDTDASLTEVLTAPYNKILQSYEID